MYSVSLMEYNTTPTSDIPTPATDELYIYDPLTTDEGLMITEPILSLEASCAGSFSCTLPETNYGYGRIIKHRTRLTVRKDDKIIFMGRINSEERDLYLNQKIKAEGALAYLNDSLTEKKVFTASNDETNTTSSLFDILDYVFTNHNNKFPNEPWKQFSLTQANCHAYFTGRNNYNVDSKQISYYSVNFYTSMETVSELLNLANAVLKLEYNNTTDKWDVYVYDKYDLPKASQPIEFGKNLIDLIQSYDATEICSAVAPFGGDAIQEDKSIGDIVAGRDVTNTYSTYYADSIWARDKDNPNAPYYRYAAQDAGYWVIDLWINDYNTANPNNKLKQLYISWRGYYFETHEGEPAGAGKCEDCAWRVYDSVGDTIGYKKFNTNGGFDEAINELIDLMDPQYLGAYRVVVSGWGGAIRPLIRRDATIVEENDKLNISKCDVMGTEPTDDLIHTAGSFYLYSKSLVNSIGRIEKKLEYDIEDTAPKVDGWHDAIPTDSWRETDLGKIRRFNDTVLAYNVGNVGDTPNYNMNKGDFQIKNLSGTETGYACIQYELPGLDDPKRPRGIYISSRMHSMGIINDDGKQWDVKGMYALYDSAWQVLSYKESGDDLFTSVKDEYIDLSAAENFGAMYVRVGGWGGDIVVDVTPSDDTYSRNKLLAQAELYLTKSQWEKKVIEATAVDLNMTSSDWESFDICTKVEVLSDFHGIEGVWNPLTRLDIQLDNFENNVIKLGYDSDEYLSYQLSENLRLQSVSQTIEERRKNET